MACGYTEYVLLRNINSLHRFNESKERDVMIYQIDLSKIVVDPPSEDSRKRTPEAVERWKKADEELKKLCEELGIEVPVLTCRGGW